MGIKLEVNAVESFSRQVNDADNSSLEATWQLVMDHPIKTDYVEGVSAYKAAKIIFEEMDKRGIAPNTLLFGKKGAQ